MGLEARSRPKIVCIRVHDESFGIGEGPVDRYGDCQDVSVELCGFVYEEVSDSGPRETVSFILAYNNKVTYHGRYCTRGSCGT